MSTLNREAISAMRKSYGEIGLPDTALSVDPIEQFQMWMTEAASNEFIVEANAMILTTVGEVGPTTRTVLLKDLTPAGFSFFTNYGSRKSKAIAFNPQVTLLFPWYAMERQVSILGKAEKASAAESDAYFASRPWGSQIGAWASAQSDQLTSREELEARYKEFAAKYPEGTTVPRPDYWGGFLVRPTTIEFWQGRYSRLHDRVIYERATPQEINWSRRRLFP
jgi:pyridoxamine 5'-phosphate oxidase